MKRSLRRMLAALALSAFLFVAPLADSCGPFFTRVIFTRANGPDPPISNFARGQIGIVLPTWWRAYLVVSYRYLSGKPLSEAEQASVLEKWDVNGYKRAPSQDDFDNWIKARAKYRNDPVSGALSEYRVDFQPYGSYVNCLPAAFTNATATLESRARSFGASSPDLQEWISGQDGVFDNCKSSGVAAVPASLPANAPALLRADRAYQIAAAHFYAGEVDAAAREFAAIGQDTYSPWHELAPYLQARAVLRKATVSTKEGTPFEPALMQQAADLFQSIVQDPTQKKMQGDARRMLGLIDFRLHPRQRQRELAHDLTQGAGADFGQDLRDYTLLLDRVLDAQPDFPGVEHWGPQYEQKKQEWQRNRYSQMKDERGDDLSDWVMTVQQSGDAARDRAVSQWKSSGAPPWLVAAIGKVHSGDGASAELQRAASEVSENSPGFASLAYHRARLLREEGKTAEARKLLNKVTAEPKALPQSALNLFLQEKMKTASSLNELTSLLARTPAAFDNGTGIEEQPSCYPPSCEAVFFTGKGKTSGQRPLLPQFDRDAARTLNVRVPVEALVEIAKAPALPANLRRRLAPSVWARAALLDATGEASAASDAASSAEPQLRPYIQAFATAKDAAERQFTAAFAILHFPGLRPYVDDVYPRTTEFTKIDDYRNNWWCGDMGANSGQVSYLKSGQIDRMVDAEPSEESLPYPSFLSAEQRRQADQQWRKFRAIGPAPRFLPRTVIDWAKQHPDDPRVPEALHLAVRSTRYGCYTEERNPYSKEAFTLLHSHYPDSAWAKKTPYWF
jgi:hypothetical protein